MEQENPTTKTVLRLLAAGALLTIAVAAPGVPWAIDRIGKDFQKFEKRKLRQVLKRLSDQEVVSFKEVEGETVIKLDEKGKERTIKINLEDLSLKEPERWDGKWRLVIFDIPERKKLAREVFRKNLKQLGFFKLQKSIFVHPFECKDEIILIRSNYNIENYVKFMVVDQIEEEKFLKDWFELE